MLAATVFGLTKIRFNTDILDMLPRDIPEVEGLRLFLDQFAQRDELIIVIESDAPSTTAGAAESLAAWLADEDGLVDATTWRPPWDEDPLALAPLSAYLLLNSPPDEISELLSTLAPDALQGTLDARLEELATGLAMDEVVLGSYDPLGLTATTRDGLAPAMGNTSEFASDDGRFRIVQAQMPETATDYRDTIAWISKIRASIDGWKQGAPQFVRVGVSLTGDPAFVAEISSSMERDMQFSGAITLVIIGGVFFLAYRRLPALIALVGCLTLTFVVTLGLGGLIRDGLTVISVGFASILIGLTVDYGVILYQRALAHGGSATELRRAAFPSIAWAAITTAAAFLALATSELPGPSELGVLVGVGIPAGAAVMLLVFAPAAARIARSGNTTPPSLGIWRSAEASRRVALAVVALLVVTSAGIAVNGLPEFDQGSETLRPRGSEAYASLDRLYDRLGLDADGLQVVVRGDSITGVRPALESLEKALVPTGATITSPAPLWPSADHQAANLAGLLALGDRHNDLQASVLGAGFTEDGFALADSILSTISEWKNHDGFPIWPDDPASRRILRRVVSQDEDGTGYALVAVDQGDGEISSAVEVIEEIPDAFPVSWPLLSAKLNTIVRDDMIPLLGVLIAVVTLLVFAALRSIRETLLTLSVVVLNLVALIGTMAWFGIGWNFVNLGALLLALGAGLDYSLHILLALREESGSLEGMGRSTGFALLVCAASTVAGFGSLSTASNQGLASLGLLCAIALAANALISIFLLPWAANTIAPRSRTR